MLTVAIITMNIWQSRMNTPEIRSLTSITGTLCSI